MDGASCLGRPATASNRNAPPRQTPSLVKSFRSTAVPPTSGRYQLYDRRKNDLRTTRCRRFYRPRRSLHRRVARLARGDERLAAIADTRDLPRSRDDPLSEDP